MKKKLNFKSKIILLKKFENIFRKSENYQKYSFWKQKVLIRIDFTRKFSNFIWLYAYI